jgi:hypothetical protein
LGFLKNKFELGQDYLGSISVISFFFNWLFRLGGDVVIFPNKIASDKIFI